MYTYTYIYIYIYKYICLYKYIYIYIHINQYFMKTMGFYHEKCWTLKIANHLYHETNGFSP